MELITSPNAWSCLPASLAMVLKVPLTTVLYQLGHDGSEILWPGVPEPECRRSFSLTEITWCAFKMRMCLVPVEGDYSVIPEWDDNYEYLNVKRKEFKLPENFFIETTLTKYDAILLGKSLNGNSHAVAWNHERQLIFDPIGYRTEYSLFEREYVLIAVPIRNDDRA